MPGFTLLLLSLHAEPGVSGNRQIVLTRQESDLQAAIAAARAWVEEDDERRAEVRDDHDRVTFYASRRDPKRTEFLARHLRPAGSATEVL